MDRSTSTSEPVPSRPEADRTQTLQSRDRTPKGRTTEETAATAATLVARGTPSWSEQTQTTSAHLPIDDPDRYSLVGEHARGGLGRIVRAVDTRLGRTVAVKELLRKSDTAEALFVREALITARLQHPGIVPVMEAGRWPNGEPYYVMKLVEGRSLKELIARNKTLEARLSLLPSVIAVAEAVGYAHSQDVIHRDVKPANVVVGEFGETVVVDWGLARDARREACAAPDLSDAELARLQQIGGDGSGSGSGSARSGSAETVSGRVIGTPQYMAPEQARGEQVDARADVYSLGALLYEVLAGVAPLSGGDADAILERLLAGPPPALHEVQPDVHADLLAIVAKAMARDRDDRYPTAKELAEDLKRFQTGQLVTAQQYGTVQLVRRWIARNRGPVAVAAIGMVAVMLVTIGMVRRVVDERNVAQRERANAVKAEHDAEERSNALRAHQAQSSVRRDPTAAVAWLKELRIDDQNAPEATAILEEAQAAGVARHVLREDDWVWDVSFSPDGTRLSTGSKDGRVRLYDLRTSPPKVTQLGVHPGGIRRSLFAGDELITTGLDGQVLAWPVGGGAARLVGKLDGGIMRCNVAGGVLMAWSEGDDFGMWDLATGEELVRLHTYDTALEGVVEGDVSPVDPAKWIVGYADGRLVRMDRGQPGDLLARLERPARRISIAPDGARVAVFDGAQLWIVGADGVAHAAGKLSGQVEQLVWSPDGSRIAAAGKLPEVRIFSSDPARAGEPRDLVGHTDSMYSVEWSRDGDRVLTGSDDGTARVWDLVTGSVEVLRGHDDDVVMASFSPDERMVATASLDGSARVWQIGATGVRVLGGDAGGITRLELVGDDTAVTVSMPFQVVRWNLATGSRTEVVPRNDDIYKMVATVSKQGLVAMSPGPSAEVTLVRADGSKTTLTGHTDKVTGAAFSHDGKHLFTASADQTVRRWDVASGASEVIIEGPVAAWLSVSPDNDRLLVMRPEHFALHDTDGKLLQEIRRDDLPRGAAVKFSPDRKTIAIASKSGDSLLWQLATDEVLVLDSNGHHATNLAFSPDGRHLAGAMADRTVRVWDTATGTLVHTLIGHVDLVLNLAYSPDGRQLATASYDRTVRIWDVATGQSRILRGHALAVQAVAWLDGDRLVTGSLDGTVRVWPVPSTATPSISELRRSIELATSAVVGAGERVATPRSE